MPPSYDCQDAGCTWPCAHHLHRWIHRSFRWYPDSEQFSHKNPQIPRALSEMKVGMKDCQFCRIFFTIRQSGDCHCGANGHGDHIPESGGCRCIEAICWMDGQFRVVVVEMRWTCGQAFYELGLPTGKVVWSLYDLSNKSFLTHPQLPTPAFSHGYCHARATYITIPDLMSLWL